MQHVDIDDPYIHEPKGASTATAGQIYIANGAGSGVWTTPVYGEKKIEGNALTFTPNAADITNFKKLASTGWANGEASGVALNTDDITLTTAGVYEVCFWSSIVSSAAINTKFGVKYGLDGSTAARKMINQKNSAGSDHIILSASGIVSATAGQVLAIYMSSSAATAFTVEDAGLYVVKLK
jgi:hypothetical protein